MSGNDMELGKELGRLAEASETQASAISKLASTMQVWQLQGLPKCVGHDQRMAKLEEDIAKKKGQRLKVWGVEIANFDMRDILRLVAVIAIVYAILVANGILPRLNPQAIEITPTMQVHK